MALINHFLEYFNYLIHPFKTHEALISGEDNFRLSAYESLTTSWVFVILNGILRIILLNFILLFLFDLTSTTSFDLSTLINVNEFPGLYFLVLSAITDIIFYPLFGVFIIQFWEVVLRFYGKLIGSGGDLTQKAQDIISVSFSSKILTVIPFLGSTLESLASLVLMYAGIRTQLKASIPLTLCILFTPFLLLLMIGTMIFTLFLVAI